MRLAGGLILALASSIAFALSYTGQYAALSSGERLVLHRPLWSLALLLRNRRWLLGYAASWGGWGLYIAALALAPLSLVQSVNAGVIGPLALFAHRGGHRLSRRQRSGTFLGLCGLLLVLATTPAPEHSSRPGLFAVLVLVGGALVISAGLCALLPARSRGAALGISSGLLYGAGDVATKAAVSGETALGPVFLVLAALGFVTLQLSYQRTSLLGSAGISSLFTNAIPIAAGVLLFGESPSPGLLALRCAGFVADVVCAVALAEDNEGDVVGQVGVA